MKDSGVYQIINKISGKRYIGSTVNLYRRQRQHYSALRCGRHDNPHLQAAWNLYGNKAFAFAVLEHVIDLERLLEREQYYLDVLQPEYNIALVAGKPTAGRTLSEEHKRKLSQPKSEEFRRKISEAQKGTVRSAATRAKVREARTGRKASEETKRKLRDARGGESNSNAKLSEQDVREIKALLAETALSQREIAARYGVEQSTVGCIKCGRTWIHVGNTHDVATCLPA